MDQRAKAVYAAAVGALTAIIVVFGLTVAAELYRPFWEWLRDAFSHHWVGKGILASVAFVLAGGIASFVPVKDPQRCLRRWLWATFWVGLAGSLALLDFFLYEAFVAH